MKVLIVGKGAVGTWFGGRLAAIGSDVVYAPRELADVVPVAADLAVVAVKAYDTPGAIETLRAALGTSPSATILTLQNGVGNEDALAKAFGADTVVAGALTVPVDCGADGDARAANSGGLGVAPVGAQPHNWLIAALAATGIPLRVVSDSRALKWSKLALNITANAACAILNMPPDRLLLQPKLFALEMEALRELRAVMHAAKLKRIDLPRYPVRMLLDLALLPSAAARLLLASRIAKARGSKLPSLLVDLRAEKTRSEVAWLNGAVAGAGRSLSLATPVNAALTRVLDDITTMPALWAKYREHPEALLAEVAVERRPLRKEIKLQSYEVP